MSIWSHDVFIHPYAGRFIQQPILSGLNTEGEFSIHIVDAHTGERRTIQSGEVARVRVRADGSFAFRRQFTRWRPVQPVGTRWRWQRGASK